MTTEETEARLLAEWLSTPAGTPPPEGLALDVVAAVYAMRPDRAPAPRVSIEDVYPKVEQGPYAQVPASTTGHSPGSARRREASGTRSAGRSPKRRTPWWMGPAVGLALSAAAAVMFVLPIAGKYVAPSVQDMAEQAVKANEFAPPVVAPASPEPDAGGGAMSAPHAARSAPAASPPMEPMPAPATSPAEGAREEAAPTDGIAELPRREREAQTTVADAAPGARDKQDGSGAAGLGAGSGGYGGPSGGTSTKDEDAPATSPPPPPVSTPAPNGIPELAKGAEKEEEGWWGGDAEKKSAAAPAAKPQSPAPTPSQGQNAGKAKTTPTKPSSAPAPSQAPAAEQRAYDAADEEMDDLASKSTRSASGASAGEVAAVTRSDASPTDYNASAVTTRADVAAAYAAADAARAAGRTDDAVAAYAPLLADADARVAQDAAWRQASLLRSAGRADTALSVVKRGLARSTSNTAFRSNLLVLEGDLLAARGDSAGAAKAYAEAARLNGAR